MRILVTNDDGITAPGLQVAEEIATEIAGPDGEVWIAAPAFEQSGVSHAISFTSPIKVEQLSDRRFAIAGTPADCVIVAVHDLMKDNLPDLVLSGVNRGHNIAEDAVYSGTVGGAIEAALQRLPAIALSQYFRRPAASDAPDPDLFSAARNLGVDAVRRLLATEWTPDLFYNVNFPPVPAADAKGFRFAHQGRRTSGAFGAARRASPAGRAYFWLDHRIDNRSAGDGADSKLCADGYVTAVPMRADYTDYVVLQKLENAGADE